MGRKSVLRTRLTNVVRNVDPETGEIINESVNKHTYLANTKEDFFIGYVSILGIFQKLNSAEVRIYAHLLENYNSDVLIGINDTVKKKISEKTDIKVGTINNALMRLCNSDEHPPLLVKIGRGTYQLNPRYAFKGSTQDRDKNLKFLIEFRCKDC